MRTFIFALLRFVFVFSLREWTEIYRLDKKNGSLCCLSVFLFPSPLEKEHKIFTKLTRKRFEARASTRDHEI